MALNLSRFEAIEWDDDDDADGNVAHCMRQDHLPDPQRIVYEVLSESPVELKMRLTSAEFAIVGPDFGGAYWVILLVASGRKGELLRPVTGWPAGKKARAAWNAGRKL